MKKLFKVMISFCPNILLFLSFNQDLVSAGGNNQTLIKTQKTIDLLSALSYKKINTLTASAFNYDKLTRDYDLTLFNSLKEASPDLYQFYDDMTKPNKVEDTATLELLKDIKTMIGKTRKISSDLKTAHCAYMIFFIAQYYKAYYKSFEEGKADPYEVAKRLANHFFTKKSFYVESITKKDTEISRLNSKLSNIRSQN